MTQKHTTCTDCGKYGCHSKNLCPPCYSRMRRKTPEGKALIKKYNDSEKAIACRKRYNLRKPPKTVRVQKICECGELAVAKDLCRKCYQRAYSKKNYVPKIRVDQRAKKLFTPEVYNRLKDMVISGLTIKKSCKLLGFSASWVYRNLSPDQKIELKKAKVTQTRKNP